MTQRDSSYQANLNAVSIKQIERVGALSYFADHGFTLSDDFLSVLEKYPTAFFSNQNNPSFYVHDATSW